MVDQQEQSAPQEEPAVASSSSQETPEASSSAGEGSSSASATPAPAKHCAHCKASESGDKVLKPCSKCQTALYCSRDCQKAGYKVHKKTCAKDAQIYALKADLKPSAPPKVPKEGYRGGLQKWQFDT